MGLPSVARHVGRRHDLPLPAQIKDQGTVPRNRLRLWCETEERERERESEEEDVAEDGEVQRR